MSPRLSKALWAALRDIAQYPGPYIWKPASMAKLADLGLVEKTGRIHASRAVYRLTDAGSSVLAAGERRDA